MFSIFYNFIYLFIPFLAVLGLRCCVSFSLVAASGGYPLVVVCWLLIAVTSLVGHRLWGTWASVVAAHGLSSCGFQALQHRLSSCVYELSCSAAWGIFPRAGIEPMSPALEADRFFTTESPGKPPIILWWIFFTKKKLD